MTCRDDETPWMSTNVVVTAIASWLTASDIGITVKETELLGPEVVEDEELGMYAWFPS
jgi:hypothetical protein